MALRMLDSGEPVKHKPLWPISRLFILLGKDH